MTKHIREVAPSGIENVSRRGVLKGMASTGGLVLAVTVLPHRAALADAPKWGADGMPHGTVNNPHVFVSIAPDGTVTIVCHRSEMGPGRADRHAAHRRRRARGGLGQGESRPGDGRRGQVRQPGHRRIALDPPLLRADAPGRRRRAHDARGRPPPSAGASTSPTWRRRTTRSFRSRPARSSATGNSPPTPQARRSRRRDSLRLKDPSQFRYIGKEGTNIVDGFDITTGRAIYGQDVRLPGQKYAVVARPPVMGGKVASYDATRRRRSRASSRSSRSPRRPIP